MNKKNIVFFLPNFSYGGAGKSILNICKNLSKKKYDIFVISLNKNYYKKDLQEYCKEIVEIKSTRTLLSLKKIKTYITRFDKDRTLLVSNINYANALFVIYFKLFNNFKVILIERTPFQELFIYFGTRDFIKKFIIKVIVKYFYRFADEIITNSKKISKDFTNYTKKKCKYIYPLTLNKIKKSKKKILTKKQKIDILTISRLSKEKNLIEQLKAVKNLKSQRFFLNIVGDGEQKEKLENFIKLNKINAKIYKYSEKNKINLLKICKLYICSSFFEGFPNAVLEAINYNLPIISSKNHGGIYEIILNKRGGDLYQTGNEQELKKILMEFQNNYKKKLKKNLIAKKFLNRFTTRNIKQYEKIFDKNLLN